MASLSDRRLSLSFDCRYGTSWEPERLVSAIEEKLRRIGWTCRLHENSPGYQIPGDAPLLRKLLAAYETATGTEGARAYLSAGGTYARHLKNAFSMGDTNCPHPFAVPAGHGHAHQPDEMISLAGLLDSTAILTEMILACDAYLNEG